MEIYTEVVRTLNSVDMILFFLQLAQINVFLKIYPLYVCSKNRTSDLDQGRKKEKAKPQTRISLYCLINKFETSGLHLRWRINVSGEGKCIDYVRFWAAKQKQHGESCNHALEY